MNASTVIFPSLVESKVKKRDETSGSSTALVTGFDGKNRPAWVGSDPLLQEYYDHEWGRVVITPDELFELQSLFVFQTGLRWRSVLQRRNKLRDALAGFSFTELSVLSEADIDELQKDDRLIKNRAKIAAVVNNAKVVSRLGGDGWEFSALVWRYQPLKTLQPEPGTDLPETIAESVSLAKELKALGFAFVGPRNCFALMQAAGVVDANPLGSINRGLTGLWDDMGNRVRRPSIPDRLDTSTRV